MTKIRKKSLNFANFFVYKVYVRQAAILLFLLYACISVCGFKKSLSFSWANRLFSVRDKISGKQAFFQSVTKSQLNRPL